MNDKSESALYIMGADGRAAALPRRELRCVLVTGDGTRKVTNGTHLLRVSSATQSGRPLAFWMHRRGRAASMPTAMVRKNGEYHGTGSIPSNTQLYLRYWFEKYSRK